MQLFLLFPLQVIAYLYKVSSWKALAALRPWGCCYHIICWQTRCKSGCLPLGIRSKVRFYEGKKRSFYLNLIFKKKIANKGHNGWLSHDKTLCYEDLGNETSVYIYSLMWLYFSMYIKWISFACPDLVSLHSI